jgi:hypothetical protein
MGLRHLSAWVRYGSVEFKWLFLVCLDFVLKNSGLETPKPAGNISGRVRVNNSYYRPYVLTSLLSEPAKGLIGNEVSAFSH